VLARDGARSEHDPDQTDHVERGGLVSFVSFVSFVDPDQTDHGEWGGLVSFVCFVSFVDPDQTDHGEWGGHVSFVSFVSLERGLGCRRVRGFLAVLREQLIRINGRRARRCREGDVGIFLRERHDGGREYFDS
jgi:hypothetical protein